MNRYAFWVCYIVINISPIYAIVFANVEYHYGVPGWIIMLPISLLFVPVGMYLFSRWCPNCTQVIYTTEHLRDVPGGFRKIPFHIFHSCPECGHKVI